MMNRIQKSRLAKDAREFCLSFDVFLEDYFFGEIITEHTEYATKLSTLGHLAFAETIRASSFMDAIERSNTSVKLHREIAELTLAWMPLDKYTLLSLALIRVASGAVAVYCDVDYFGTFAESYGMRKASPPSTGVVKAATKLLTEAKKQGLNLNPIVSDLKKLADGRDLGDTPIVKDAVSNVERVVVEISAKAADLLEIKNKKEGRFPNNTILALLIDVLEYPCANEDERDNLKKQILRSQVKYKNVHPLPLADRLWHFV
ncbi:hypothetical protein N8137_06385 [Porticoccaceae bacterium]|nr:hypothetical protein [Porticoccaceae bacterium]